MRFLFVMLLVFAASTAMGQTSLDQLDAQNSSEYLYSMDLAKRRAEDQIKQAPARQAAAIESMRDEIKALKIELQLIRDLLQKMVDKQPAAPPTRKVWKKVRPSIQIEGMIDDGYELVEEPTEKKTNE